MRATSADDDRNGAMVFQALLMLSARDLSLCPVGAKTSSPTAAKITVFDVFFKSSTST